MTQSIQSNHAEVLQKPLLIEEKKWADLPRDILAIIFLHLNCADQVNLSIVCKNWHRLYKEKASLVFVNLFSNPIYQEKHQILFSSNGVIHPPFFLENKSVVFREHKDVTILNIEDGSKKTFEEMDIIGQTENLLFLSSSLTSEYLICVEKNSWEKLFELKISDGVPDKDLKFFKPLNLSQRIKGFAVLATEPLTFLIVTAAGNITTWVWDQGPPKCVDCWHIFEQNSDQPMVSGVYNVLVIDSWLIVYGLWKKGGNSACEETAMYNLNAKIKLKPPFTLRYQFSTIGSLLITRSKTGIFCYHLDQNKIERLWHIKSYDDSLRLIAGPDKDRVIISNGKKIQVLNLYTGNTLKTIACPTEDLKSAKLMGDILALFFPTEPTFVMIDLQNETVRQVKGEDAKIYFIVPTRKKDVILDVNIVNHSQLIVLRATEMSSYRGIDYQNYRLESLTPKKNVKEKYVSSSQVSENIQQERPPSSQKLINQKITAIVLGVLSLIALGLSVYLYTHRGINLSIGLMTSAFLLSIGSAYLGIKREPILSNCHCFN